MNRTSEIGKVVFGKIEKEDKIDEFHYCSLPDAPIYSNILILYFFFDYNLT